jgi:uncharacterized protein YecT (DUF1311 family)
VIWAVAAFVVVPLAAQPTLAQSDKPDAKDSAAVPECIKAKTGWNWAWKGCIGVVSRPCAKDEIAMPPSEIIACYDQEREVSDDILNKSFKTLREGFEDKQIRKLLDMQRAWIASRDKSCAFLYDYSEGSMANPMMAACPSRETGWRALCLRGFAYDVEERK